MSTSSFRLAAALLAAAAASIPAHAQQSSASASLSNIRIELIDLDLSDNIAPSIFFDTPSQAANVSRHMPYDAESTWVNGAVELGGADGGARASLGTDALSAGSWFLPGTGIRSFESEAWRTVGFTLSPNTGLMLLADGALDVDDQGSDFTSASIFLRLHLQRDGDITGHKDAQRYHSSEQGARDYRMSVYLASGKLAVDGYFSVSARSETAYYATPVPEPAGWGMLLAGAVLVGAAARRRVRTHATAVPLSLPG